MAIFLGSECTRIDVRAFIFQNYPGGGGGHAPRPLDWCGFTVSCQSPILKYLLMPTA